MPITFKPCLKAYRDKNGLQQLVLRLTMDRKARYADSGYSISAKQYNPSPKSQDSYVRSTHPQAEEINEALATMIGRVKAWLKEYPDSPLEELTPVAEGNPPVKLSPVDVTSDFFAYAEQYLSQLTASYATHKNLRNAINHAKAFTGGKLSFGEINLKWAKGFQAYLLANIKGRAEHTKGNSGRIYANKVGHLLKRAMEDELIPIAVSPFSFLKWKKVTVRRVPLEESEIAALEQVQLTEGSLEFIARNVFLFQFYLAGMRISDVLLLRWSQISEDRVDYVMKKTSLQMSFPLVEKAARLLKYYAQWKEPDGFVFPLLNNRTDYSDKVFRDKQLSVYVTMVDRYIKRVALKAGITKHISSHLARHTFGHLATLNGLSAYDLRDCFGHSTTRMTDVYTSRFDQKRLDKSLLKVMGTPAESGE